MFQKKYNLYTEKGLSLLEIVVSMFVIMMLGLGVYSLIIFSLNITADNKMYVEAVRIANQKMEQVFNLPYNQAGLIFGEPEGVLSAEEYSGQADKYLIKTDVSYYDDPYDGLGSEDDDINDYKVVTVKILFDGKTGPRSVILFSKIVPNSL